MSAIILPNSTIEAIDYNNFEHTDKIGKRGEARFRDYLLYEGLKINTVAMGYQPKYDITYIDAYGKLTSAEIKTCLSDSLNIPFEYHSRGKPSGIASTEAEHFIVYREHYDKICIGKTDDIRGVIEFLGDDYIPKVSNNRNATNTKLYLFNERLFESYEFEIIDLSNVPRIHKAESE